MGRLVPGEAHFYDLNGDEVEKECVTISFSAEAAEKGGYEHFMMKEIHEQPRVLRDTFGSAVLDDVINLGVDEEALANIRQLYIVACGSAYHAGIAGQYVIEDLAEVPVRVELASEFRYRKPKFSDGSFVIIISQSGETADSLAALRLANEKNVPTMAIVNVVGSSIAREAKYVFYTQAGPEIAVATTKAYSTQLLSLYLFAIQLAKVRGNLDAEAVKALLAELSTLPAKTERLLEEGSLKMKEISYIHSDAYAAGELKHGTISLIEDNILVVGSLTQPELYEKTVSNMVEVKSRGASLMAITTYGHYSIEDLADFVVYVPKTDPHFLTSLAIIPLQLLAYYTAVARGEDVDKPRNLAKSVTVE